ncbi:hypothetical protein QZH44_30135 (plasmid) [Pseudomonas corrugata]|uniref:hypothetical protein n=1 Tax=Pseudomonas corrugata TaxID=47879 RepID=UPI003D8166F3
MCGVNGLIGSGGNFSLKGYLINFDIKRMENILHALHSDIPGSHDLLIALVLTQECVELRERSSVAIEVVLRDYESALNLADRLRAKMFFVAVITELKMVLDELKILAPAEQDKVLSRLCEHFGPEARKLDTSFEGMEQIFLLSNPSISKYWLSLMCHAK